MVGLSSVNTQIELVRNSIKYWWKDVDGMNKLFVRVGNELNLGPIC